VTFCLQLFNGIRDVYRIPCYYDIGDQVQTGGLVLLLIILFTADLAFIGMMDSSKRTKLFRCYRKAY
jgi:hypothetical protein